MSYSLLTANINNYDTFNECFDNIATNKVMVTNTAINTKTWKIIYDNSWDNTHPFNQVFNVRWNPFKYINDDIIVWIDSSMKVSSSIALYVDSFVKTGAELGIVIHPKRTNILDEYIEWITTRNYDKQHAFENMAAMEQNGCNVRQGRLVQTGVLMLRNTERIHHFCSDMLQLITTHGKNNSVDRLDQTWASYLLNTTYKDMKTHFFTESIYKSKQMQIGGHKK